MIPTGVSMVVSGGAVSPENRSNEDGWRCGYAVVDRDGEEQPCDRPATGWRWYQDCDHEDTLDVACELHANEAGRRLAAVERRCIAAESERDAAVAENARLVARIAAVEARNTAALALARFYSCDANGYDEIAAALAASPTPTGPQRCPAGICKRSAGHEGPHRDGPGPATPEPTEETP